MHENKNVVGSWFPTGYHGHFRSRSRINFNVPYREYAKPAPPNRFLDRTKIRSDQHLFSRHDNRNSHLNRTGDLEIHFNMGLGKRKSSSSQHSKNTSTLLDWNMDTKVNHTSVPRRDHDRKPRIRSAIVSTTYERIEPVHIRQNLDVQRKLYSTTKYPAVIRTAPLLAWNLPCDQVQNFKPCIGDTTKRCIPRVSYDPVRTKTLITERLEIIKV